MNLKYEVGQSVAIEVPKTITETITEIISAEIKSITIGASGAKYLTSKGAFTEEQLDSYAQSAQEEPAQPKEPIKLYCVKDYNGLCHRLCKGEVYEWHDGALYVRGEHQATANKTYEEWAKINSGYAECLIPLVSRPAKTGEWVLTIAENRGLYKKGDVSEVVRVDNSDGTVRLNKTSVRDGTWIHTDHYLVLDGYAPEPEAEPEPEYYNGKVVCVDNGGKRFFEVGKVYCFYNGVIFGANGFYSSKYETLEKANCGIGSKFIEFKGE